MSNLTLTHRSLNYEGLLEGILTCLACDIGQLSLVYTWIVTWHVVVMYTKMKGPFRVIPKMSAHARSQSTRHRR